jgi:hypothetical protein
MWYHFLTFNTLYGSYASLAIFPGLYLMYRKSKDRQLFYAMLCMVCIVYIFFTLAATKMPSFPTVVAMIIMIAFATLFDTVLSLIERTGIPKKALNAVFILSVLLTAIIRLDAELLQERHTAWKKDNTYSAGLISNRAVFKSLKLPPNTVLFNVMGRHYIEAMFYTGFPSYNFIPSAAQYEDMKKKGRTIAVFRLKEGELPPYLKNDTSVIIINKEILVND